MLKSVLIHSLVFCLVSVVLSAGGFAQKKDDGATIRGKFEQSKYKGFGINLQELKPRIQQVTKLPEPNFPADWKSWDPKKRQEWAVAFEKSPAGKKFVENNQRILKSLESFELRMEKNGTFVVYNVPVGKYSLRGRVDKVKNNRNFAFEVFGEVSVLEDVDELILDPIMVMVTPLLKIGEPAPNFSLKTHNDAATLVPRQFRGKYVFVNFWSTESKPSVEFQKEVQEMYETLNAKYKGKFELLSVNLDEKRKAGIKHIVESKLKGRHGFTDGWDHRTLEAFGVRAIPSHWLLSPDGKISMTHMDIRRAMFAGKPNLATIVEDRILGKDVPTLAPKNPQDKKPKESAGSTSK